MGTPTSVGLDDLSSQQLLQVKKQLDEELDHVAASYSQLQMAQSRFKESLTSVQTGFRSRDDQDTLVPLSNSLYCMGKISGSNRVLVDIGTGYFIEKTTTSATHFYTARVEEIGKSLAALEGIMQQKTANSQAVDGVLRQKLSAPAAGPE